MAMLYATIATIILNIILIPKFGKEGSALATVLAQIIVPVYLFYRGKKVYPIPYKFTEIVMVTITLLAIVVSIRLINFEDLWFQIFVKIIVTILLMAGVFFLNRNSIKSILPKIKK